MKIRPLKEHFYSIGWGRNKSGPIYKWFLLFNSSSSLHKAGAFAALTTILALTEVISAFFGLVNRKEINTENGFHNYTRTA
jgi:hypothetical protein